eukprot:202675-Alexandrium_andersonii.AAC.1
MAPPGGQSTSCPAPRGPAETGSSGASPPAASAPPSSGASGVTTVERELVYLARLATRALSLQDPPGHCSRFGRVEAGS